MAQASLGAHAIAVLVDRPASLRGTGMNRRAAIVTISSAARRGRKAIAITVERSPDADARRGIASFVDAARIAIVAAVEIVRARSSWLAPGCRVAGLTGRAAHWRRRVLACVGRWDADVDGAVDRVVAVDVAGATRGISVVLRRRVRDGPVNQGLRIRRASRK